MESKFGLKHFTAGNCYSYIISSGKDAFVIDPHINLVDEYSKYLKKNQLNLSFIIDTHTHADHFSSAAILKKQFSVPIMMSHNAVSEISDKRLKENDPVTLGSCSFKVIETPGHTDDSISLYGEGRLFTGDVLLIGSVGRTDFQNGSPESMFQTLQKLKALPNETIVLPAHDYNGNKSSTIGKEKVQNQYMMEESEELFVQQAKSKVLPKPFNIENIISVNQKGEAASLELISPEMAMDLTARDRNVQLLDVRSTLEYAEVHIKNSINVPIDALSTKINELCKPGTTYIVFCRTGNRSPMAADMLLHAGINSVKIMAGGITRWQKNKLGVVKGKSTVSLERQVRIIAGFLMLIGILLAGFIHKGFIAISIWVACGLIFAGISNSCIMGMLLMKLPYNKKIYKSETGGGSCSIE